MRRRLVVWVAISTLLFWVAGAALGTYVMQDEFGEIFDSAMQETADRLLPLAIDDIEKGEVSDVPKNVGRGDGYLVYQVRNKDGHVLMRSHEASSSAFEAPLVEGFWQGPGMRVFTRPSRDKTLFVQVGDAMTHRAEAVQDGIWALLLPLALLVPFSVVAVFLIVGRATAPLLELRNAIAKRDSGNLASLPTNDLPAELEPIAVSLNLVLSRLADALSAEREFAANSAHELRTPIAGAMAQVQLLIEELGTSKSGERARLIEQSVGRLASLTEKLLQLSRADAGIGRADTPHDLLPVIRMVVEDAKRHFADRAEIHLVDNDEPLVRLIDPDGFAIVMRNLIENAVLHGDCPATVTITSDQTGRITVSNPARPYDDVELNRLRQRFHHADTSVAGSGLGLSIVERLLSHMNAELVLGSSIADGRTVFAATIRFR